MSLFKHILHFLLPWACAGCRAALGNLEDCGFCGACWLAVPRIQGIVCYACGSPLKEGGRFCYGCRTDPPSLLIRAATEFRGVIRPSIYRFKYVGRKTLVRPFGVLMRYAWDHYLELQDIQGVIPVPLHPKNQRLRGFNQAELLARQLASDIGYPMLPLLRRSHRTVSQTNLNRRQRRENVAGAFTLQPLSSAMNEIIRGRSFLLIDDVCTTGSTLAACATVLKRAGVRSVKALVLARDL